VIVASRLWVCAAAAALCGTLGATEQVSVEYLKRLPDVDGIGNKEPSGFWEHFQQAFNSRSAQVFTDSLHPLKVMGWQMSQDNDTWQDVVERGNRKMKYALTKSMQYSLRDASVVIPIANWLEGREDALAEFFLNSVDAVEEEAVQPLNPGYRPAERRWWQDVAQRKIVSYGIRPFRTDPYTFLSVRFQDEDRLILLGHVRYYFQDLTDHRFDVALSLPVGQGFALDAGTTYQFGPHDDETRFVVKLSKAFKQGGIMHLGIEVKSSPTVFAGISLPL